MPNTIFAKDNQRFFIEPEDVINPENSEDILTFANPRLTEYLHLFTIVDNRIHIFKTGRPDRAKEHSAYEVTFANAIVLAKVYKLQQDKTLPMILWTAQGNGPARRYVPEKPDLKGLFKKGVVKLGSTHATKEMKH